jgi:DNA-binding NtrC family response regulator
MPNRTTVLLIHNDPGGCPALRGAAETQGFELACATAAAGVKSLRPGDPDVVVLDLGLPGGSGLDAFRQIRGGNPRCPVVLLTAPGAAEPALTALKEGAFACLVKPADADHLGALLEKAAEAARLMRPPSLLPAPDSDDRLIARSPPMRELCQAVARLAPQEVPVLITGESGSGKELVARALYQHSRRADRLFLAVNCAALPERLLEAELFGQARGVVAGSGCRAVGKFEQCRGGTLLLDEVGDMPLPVQSRLLRALREGCFERPGGAEVIPTDVRLLAATGQDLEDLVARGCFLAELSARLREAAVRVPALRERREDIGDLAHAFLLANNGELGLNLHGFTPEAAVCLQDYPWPGNVRELRGAIREAMLRARGPLVRREALPEPLAGGARGPEAPPPAGGLGLEALLLPLLRRDEPDLYPRATQALDRVLLLEVLRRTRGNQKRASEILGIDRKTLRKKLLSTGLLRGPLSAACPAPANGRGSHTAARAADLEVPR